MTSKASADDMNVFQYYENIFSSRKKELDSDLSLNEKFIAESQTTINKLAKEVKKLRCLRENLATNGMNTAEADNNIKTKEEEFQKIEASLAVAIRKVEEVKALIVKNEHEPIRWLLEHAKNILHYEEIPVVESVSDLYRFACITLQTKDGEPTFITASLPGEATNLLKDIALVKAADKIVQCWVSEDIGWVPEKWLTTSTTPPTIDYDDSTCAITTFDDSESDELQSIYFDRSKKSLISTKNKYHWQTKNQNFDRYNRSERDEWVRQSRDISKDIVCLQNVIKAEAERHNHQLDLEVHYEEGTFFAYIQKLVLKNVHDKREHSFKLVDKKLKSEEIQNLINEDWDSFVNGPWLPGFRGLLANLKYYCESKERPRFYSMSVDKSYGFRLRTRDHSWILGQIVILPETNSSFEAKVDIQIPHDGAREVNEENPWIIRSGKLAMRIQGEERTVLPRR